MKNMFLAIALMLGISEMSAVPLAIYGRAYVNGNKVWCGGGRRLCAVIPRAEDNGPPDPQGLITIYGSNGDVQEQHAYSSITIEEDGEGTAVSWMP